MARAIDATKVRATINDHKRGGGKPSFYDDNDDFRVIDLLRRCLIRAQPEHEYAALSYVWGGVKIENYQTTLENLPSRERDGAFDPQRLSLPETIVDSMILASQLKIRYLWIDALCIVQNDAQSKHRFISNMDVVYLNAYLTIVAAAGNDATAGLSGVSKTRPRSIPQKWLEFEGGGRRLILSQRPFDVLLGN